MNDTTRTFPRSARDAFREWHENAIGIDGPAIQPAAPWWVRAIRWLFT